MTTASAVPSAHAVHAAHEAGALLPGPGFLFGAIFFGLAGFAAWRYGKAVGSPAVRWLGAALMLFPCLMGRTWLEYLVGFGLCAAIWWQRPGRD